MTIPLYKKYKTMFSNFGVVTNKRITNFMGQIEHESGLKPISENTNYSRKTLLTVFKKYFNEGNVDEYLGNGKKILNRAYANRMGNGDEMSGDGYKYRGRGFIQITGKSNYEALSKYMKIDYVNDPDLLLTEADALISALWYWDSIKGNRYADKGDIKGLTKAINGGHNGIEDRIEKTKKWENILSKG